MGASSSNPRGHAIAIADYAAEIPQTTPARAIDALNPEIFRVDLLKLSHSIFQDPLVPRTVYFPEASTGGDGGEQDLNWLVFGFDAEADVFHGRPHYSVILTEWDCLVSARVTSS